MATEEQAGLEMHGPVATHTVPCAFYGCEAPAVIDVNLGIFQPCWTHQGKGYAVRQSWKGRFAAWRKR